MGTLRQTIIHRRRKRKEKLAKLRRLFLQAQNEEEKNKVLEKLFKIAPHVSNEEFLLSIKQSQKQR